MYVYVPQEHGRCGRRLVDVTVRDKFLKKLLYSYRQQHVVRDHSEYLLVKMQRPPLFCVIYCEFIECYTFEMNI